MPVHGFCSTSYSWRWVAPALAERYTVIAPDLRGQGDSALDEYARTHARPGTLRAALDMYRTMTEDISAARDLARTPLRMRVLALGGAESFGAAVADGARPLAPHLQGGVIEQAAHFLAE